MTVPAVVDHVTAVLVVPVTAAVNCCVIPEYAVAVVGEIVTATLAGLPANAEIEHKISAQLGLQRFINSSESCCPSALGPKPSDKLTHIQSRTRTSCHAHD